MLNRRFMHFLWRKLPKQSAIIKGAHIEYLVLPWWMILSSDNRRFGGGQAIVHHPSRTAMVFISSRRRDAQFRYLLFHEWYEAQALLNKSREERFTRICKQRLALLDAEHPELLPAVADYSEETGDFEHVFALLAELTLAKREMGPEAFRVFLSNAISRRL